jgi:hypothetical protein
MTVESLSEISLGGAALAIFILCAGYMIIRGLVRTIVNTAFFTLSAWIGFRVWQQAPALAIQWTGDTSPFITTGLPVVAFLGSFYLLRKIINFFRAPLARSAEDAAPRSAGQLMFRLLFALVPAVLICLTAATFLHHASSVAEIRDFAKPGETDSMGSRMARAFRESLSSTIPPALMDWLDPLASDPRVKLVKMIAAREERQLEPVIDPETGRPYPRAIIIDDPELQALANQGRFSTLLRHPSLSEALEDPQVRQALGLLGN